MPRKDATVKARQLARAKLSAHLAAQRKREQAIEADLAVFFDTDAAISAAAAQRDAAIAKANDDYARATEAVTARRADALARLRANGQTVAALTELTGLPQRQLRALIASAPDDGDSPAASQGSAPDAMSTDTAAAPKGAPAKGASGAGGKEPAVAAAHEAGPGS
ncbi:hypothetical protein FOS14_22065 [Skermania sp. ID1734]|uniref:hypothetical protein n=1 Tax=Skermania sp. ID1734 TaxID=2597516 RepID=UPI00117FFEC6|nr:hypothetical protein [Skermania sp. ID1734]TSD93753.1 hypothetical protein FOS14_22065 [Skermania sp. ID1734]